MKSSDDDETEILIKKSTNKEQEEIVTSDGGSYLKSKVFKKSPICPWIFGHHRVTVEPIVFLCVFAASFTMVVLQQFILIRTCRITMNYNNTICDKMEKNATEVKEFEEKTQAPTATLLMINGILCAIGPAFISLFLGPRSDKYGRKFLMISPMFGYAVSNTLIMVMALASSLHPYFIMLMVAPIVFSGGLMSFLASCAAMIADISAPERRSLRMGIFDICITLGFVFGISSSGFVKEAFGEKGYFIVFLTSAVLFYISLIYVIFMLPESVSVDDTFMAMIKNTRKLFDCKLFLETLNLCFKKRENCRRDIIIMQAFILSTQNIVLMGEISVLYYYTRIKFGWNIIDCTIYIGALVIIMVIGTGFGITVFSAILHVDDLWFIILALITKIFACIIFAFSPYGWCMYLGASVQLFYGVVTPLSRSFISKNIPPDILGAVFTVAAAVEAVLPAATIPVYTNIYIATVPKFPATFFFASAIIFTIDIVLCFSVKIIHNKHKEN